MGGADSGVEVGKTTDIFLEARAIVSTYLGLPAAKKAAKQTAKKTPTSKAAAPKDSAPKPALGWPLPPPFKLGR